MKTMTEVKDKTKTIWKEHKKEIVAGIAVAVITGVTVNRINHDDAYRFVKTLKMFEPDKDSGSSIFDDFAKAMNGCNYANVYGEGTGVTVEDLCKQLYNGNPAKGIGLDTEVTGAIVFLNKQS